MTMTTQPTEQRTATRRPLVAEPQAPAWFDMREHLTGLGAYLAAPANVIMQLSWPGVGHGVAESKVESGMTTRHPIKRARTTFSYIAVSLLGDDTDRRLFRRAVNGQHAQVRSEPGAEVSYNAMDPRLQLWVAACLYYGTIDLRTRLHGPLDDATADALYAQCSRMATTLQVKPGMWPADRAAFDAYWEESLAEVSIDDTVRSYLMRVIAYEDAPGPVARVLAPFSLFFTRGFLPPLFREAMGFEWSEREEERFSRWLRRIGRLEDRMPVALRLFPFNALLWDVRRRVRTGRPLV